MGSRAATIRSQCGKQEDIDCNFSQQIEPLRGAGWEGFVSMDAVSREERVT